MGTGDRGGWLGDGSGDGNRDGLGMGMRPRNWISQKKKMLSVMFGCFPLISDMLNHFLITSDNVCETMLMIGVHLP